MPDVVGAATAAAAVAFVVLSLRWSQFSVRAVWYRAVTAITEPVTRRLADRAARDSYGCCGHCRHPLSNPRHDMPCVRGCDDLIILLAGRRRAALGVLSVLPAGAGARLGSPLQAARSHRVAADQAERSRHRPAASPGGAR